MPGSKTEAQPQEGRDGAGPGVGPEEGMHFFPAQPAVDFLLPN